MSPTVQYRSDVRGTGAITANNPGNDTTNGFVRKKKGFQLRDSQPANPSLLQERIRVCVADEDVRNEKGLDLEV